jgi:hypothetical protein
MERSKSCLFKPKEIFQAILRVFQRSLPSGGDSLRALISVFGAVRGGEGIFRTLPVDLSETGKGNPEIGGFQPEG